jgi:hypothetical protein
MSTVQLAHALLDIAAVAGQDPRDDSLVAALDGFLCAVGDPSLHGRLEVDPEPLVAALVVVLTRLAGELADARDEDVLETVEGLRPLVEAQLRG